MPFKNKVALVTGSGSGIGEAIARRLAAGGARVACNFRPGGKHAPDAMRLAHEIGGLALAGDVSQPAEVEQLMAETVAKLGRLDIAVNNAGIEYPAAALELTPEMWQKILAVNLTGPFLVAQAAARQMVLQGGGGKIVNVSSVHENVPFPRHTAYCASKGGLRMMMRNMALELAPHRINVNNVAPGAMNTPINASLLADPEAKAEALAGIPWGRFGTPEEVAAAVAFLASEEAGYVTGSTYVVDGGSIRQVAKY